MAEVVLRFGDLGWPVIAPVISCVTKHWTNHVDILTSDDTMVSALPGGVREWGVKDLSLRREARVTLYCTDAQRRQALNFARHQLGQGYDYAGVALFSFAPRWDDKRRWFCSELAAAALSSAGLLQIPDSVHRVSPGRLYRMLTRGVAASSST